jgi:hypothetical protein
MKCREKLALEHPECVTGRSAGGCIGCPSSYGYLDDPEDCGDCHKCWDREIPGTEPTEIKAQNEDLVNHPSHYTQGGMETIEEMELIFGVEAVMDYCLLNAWKYRARAPYKGNPEQDMDKANWYLNKYKELVEREYGKE